VSRPRTEGSIKARVIAGAAVAAVGGLTYVSDDVIRFIERLEGTDRTVYADKLAGGLPTACGGVTKHTSPIPVIVGDVWPEEVCREILGNVIGKTQSRLDDCLKPGTPQAAFDALTSHAHNFGVAATCSSKAVELINAGKIREGCESLSKTPSGKPNWSSVKTGRIVDGKPEFKFVQGLYNRRLAETALCLKGLP
jgi:lysozyme